MKGGSGGKSSGGGLGVGKLEVGYGPGMGGIFDGVGRSLSRIGNQLGMNNFSLSREINNGIKAGKSMIHEVNGIYNNVVPSSIRNSDVGKFVAKHRNEMYLAAFLYANPMIAMTAFMVISTAFYMAFYIALQFTPYIAGYLVGGMNKSNIHSINWDEEEAQRRGPEWQGIAYRGVGLVIAIGVGAVAGWQTGSRYGSKLCTWTSWSPTVCGAGGGLIGAVIGGTSSGIAGSVAAKGIKASTGYDATWDALFADIASGPLREAGLAGSNGELISAPAKDDFNDSNGDWLRKHKVCQEQDSNSGCYWSLFGKLVVAGVIKQ